MPAFRLARVQDSAPRRVETTEGTGGAILMSVLHLAVSALFLLALLNAVLLLAQL